MKQRIVAIYALVLCGISLLAFTGYTGTAIFQFIKYSAPKSLSNSSEMVRLSSNDLYWQSIEERQTTIAAKGRPPEAELTMRRTARLEGMILDMKTAALSDAIQNSIYAAIFCTIGLCHFLLFRRVSRAA